MLSTLDYATTAKAKPGSWCLLGPDERPLPESALPERFSRAKRGGGQAKRVVQSEPALATLVEEEARPIGNELAVVPNLEGLVNNLTPAQKAMLLSQLQC